MPVCRNLGQLGYIQYPGFAVFAGWGREDVERRDAGFDYIVYLFELEAYRVGNTRGIQPGVSGVEDACPCLCVNNIKLSGVVYLYRNIHQRDSQWIGIFCAREAGFV